MIQIARPRIPQVLTVLPASLVVAACLSLSACGDDDSGPPAPIGQLRFNFITSAVGEADGSTTLQVERIGGSRGAIGVTVSTLDGTGPQGAAKAGEDYEPMTTTVRFADGDSAPKPVVVRIINDSIHETAQEIFALTLSNPTGGATLAEAGTLVIINDDDAAPAPKASNESAKPLGTSIAVGGKGKIVAIGTPSFGSESGSVYVYTMSASDSTIAPDVIHIPAPTAQSMRFGFTVALNEEGDTLAVGAPSSNPSQAHSGSVWIYHKVDGVWSDTPAYIESGDVDAGREFGSAVALSVGTLAVSEPSGATYLFVKGDTQKWTLTQRFQAIGATLSQ